MKKLLFLILLAVISYTAYSQYVTMQLPDSRKDLRLPVIKTDPWGNPAGEPVIPGEKALDDVVGTTYYDLQSYNSIQKRIHAYDDGTIGMTWMRAMNVGSWDDRGTAYNYFDGNSWTGGEGHIETVRAGWTCYAPYGNNGEITVSHVSLDGTNFLLAFNKRENKGSGAWEEFYLEGPEGYSIVWPAMITNGENNMNIHVLALTYGDPYMDMNGAVLYYRSQDGGQTWDIEHELLDDINSNYFSGVDSDGYTWASPKGDTLAFSIGFKTQDGYVMKSYDNGNSWDKAVVYESPFSPYTGGETPTFGAGDATQSVALDSEGNAHVVFGRMRHYYDAEGTLFYYPYTEGVIYWNESMDPLDTTMVSSYTLDYLVDGGNLVGWILPYQGDSTLVDFGTYYTSLTSHPQINIDDEDNIFVMWMGAAPGFSSIDKNYRHICSNGSGNGGADWAGPKDQNLDIIYIFSECVYPAMSANFPDNMVHFHFQIDGLPGLHIWTEEHDAVENTMIYKAVEKDDFTVGIREDEKSAKMNGEHFFFPNPSGERGSIVMRAAKTGQVQYMITDLNGRQIISGEYFIDTPGKVVIPVNLGPVAKGSYLYTVVREGGLWSGMIIRK